MVVEAIKSDWDSLSPEEKRAYPCEGHTPSPRKKRKLSDDIISINQKWKVGKKKLIKQVTELVITPCEFIDLAAWKAWLWLRSRECLDFLWETVWWEITIFSLKLRSQRPSGTLLSRVDMYDLLSNRPKLICSTPSVCQDSTIVCSICLCWDGCGRFSPCCISGLTLKPPDNLPMTRMVQKVGSLVMSFVRSTTELWLPHTVPFLFETSWLTTIDDFAREHVRPLLAHSSLPQCFHSVYLDKQKCAMEGAAVDKLNLRQSTRKISIQVLQMAIPLFLSKEIKFVAKPVTQTANTHQMEMEDL